MNDLVIGDRVRYSVDVLNFTPRPGTVEDIDNERESSIYVEWDRIEGRTSVNRGWYKSDVLARIEPYQTVSEEEWAKHPGAGCTIYPEGVFWSDEHPAHEIAQMSARIEQIAGWHANSGQATIIEECRAIRRELRK